MNDHLVLGTTAFFEAANCEKKYEYHQVEKLVPLPQYVPDPVRRGVWIHSCQDARHKQKSWTETLDMLAVNAMANNVEAETVQKLREEVEDLVSGHIEFWAKEDAEYEFRASEQEYVTQVSPTLSLSATLDGLAYHERKGYGIWEYKSTQQIPTSDARGIDPQTAIQYFVARRNGIDVSWIMFDYLVTRHAPVPQVRKDGYFYAKDITTTSVAFEKALPEVREKLGPLAERYIAQERLAKVNDAAFYQRFPVYKPDAMVLETLRDIAAVRARLKLAAERGHYPRAREAFKCSRCFYSDLCATEYLLGHRAEMMRRERFMIDDGRREGRFYEENDANTES